MDEVDYRAPTVLPDGGLATVVDGERVALVDRFGDGAHGCRKMGYTRDGIAAVFEVQDGTPVCVELTLTAAAGLTVADVRAVRLERLARDVYGYAGTWLPGDDGGWLHAIGPVAAARDRARVTAKRRKIDAEFLDRVRELHAGATGTRAKVVAAALNVSPRQAARYIAKAKAGA